MIALYQKNKNILYIYRKYILKIKSNKIIIKNNKIIYIDKNIHYDVIKNTKKTIHFLNIKKNHNPLYIINVINSKKKDFFFKININKNINTFILEHNLCLKKTNKINFFNFKNNIKIKKHSHITYIRIIYLNKSTSYRLKENIKINKSSFKQYNFALKYKKIHIKIKYFLNKSNLDIQNFTLLQTKNKYKYINKILQTQSISKQKHKNIFSGKKNYYTFTGLTSIKKKSIAKTIIKNLCFNNKKPSIKISPKFSIYNQYSNCKHKVTTIKIKKEHIFYLLSRGLSFDISIKILLLCFIKKDIKKIQKYNKIHKYIDNIITKHINIK